MKDMMRCPLRPCIEVRSLQSLQRRLVIRACTERSDNFCRTNSRIWKQDFTKVGKKGEGRRAKTSSTWLGATLLLHQPDLVAAEASIGRIVGPLHTLIFDRSFSGVTYSFAFSPPAYL